MQDQKEANTLLRVVAVLQAHSVKTLRNLMDLSALVKEIEKNVCLNQVEAAAL